MAERQLSILVALHSGSLSGVDTYAEQLAAAGVAASHKVTLVAVGEDLAAEIRDRLGNDQVRVIATNRLGRSAWRNAGRQLPTFALMEMEAQLGNCLKGLGERFDVAHLNHPALASAARPCSDRVVVGAWFYPHHARGRMVQTWLHTGAVFPKSAAFAIKGLSHYWNDRRGYRSSDCVVAPTELLAAQLSSMGLNAVACPLPGRRPETARDPDENGPVAANARRRVAICCGDLSHPRKNVDAGIRAIGLAARDGMAIDLELIGRKAEFLAAELHALPQSVHVFTPGPLPRDQVDDRLRRADVLLVPSLYEEWGYVATEAVLAGTPVVAFPVYPFVEILPPPFGLCADDMSSEALARALQQVLDNGADRSFVAKAAERAFGTEAVGSRLTKIWSGAAVETGRASMVSAK